MKILIAFHSSLLAVDSMLMHKCVECVENDNNVKMSFAVIFFIDYGGCKNEMWYIDIWLFHIQKL